MRIRALGTFELGDGTADRALGRGQARELLAILVANPGAPLDTAALIAALWDEEPPPTAATIVHGAIARVRKALGAAAVIRTDDGYRLDPGAVEVDLWELDGLVGAGRLAEARARAAGPVLGPYSTRRWALPAAAELAERLRPASVPGRGALRAGGGVTPVTRLIGRRRELATLRDAHRRSRLVTVVGLGGVGKSRLVAELAGELDGRVLRVDLGLASGPFTTRLAAELGAVGGDDPDTSILAVAAILGDAPSVLVLDGCEHDLDGAADAIPFLLQRCCRLSVVATSRTALGLPGEQVVPLLPFANPGDRLGDGVELVLDRLRGLGLPLDPGDRDRAAAISLRCAGVPLAIELAAAEALTADEPHAPAGGPAAAVSDVVAEALGGLAPSTATAARRAAALPAGITPVLLADLHDGGGSAAARDLLAAGLVGVDGSASHRRLRFPDTVRAALVDAQAPGDLAVVAGVLGRHAVASRPEIAEPPALGPLAAAVHEITNAHAVLDALGRAGRDEERLALALAFTTPWREDGHWVRGSSEIEQALSAADARGRVDPATRAYALLAIVTVAGTYEAMSRWADRLGAAAADALDAGLPELATALRVHEANGFGYAGRRGEARRAVQEARAAAGASRSATVQLFVDGLEAASHLITGDPGRAHAGLVAVAHRVHALGAFSDAARLQRLASIAARAAGDLPLALREAEVAEEHAVAGLARGTLAVVRGEIADLRFVLDPASALPALRAALEVGSGAGQLRMAAVCRLRIGLLDDDPATVAAAAVELLAVDGSWAALALTHLLAALPARHPLRALIVAGMGSLSWGMPLSAADQQLVDAVGAPAARPPDGWKDVVVAELLARQW